MHKIHRPKDWMQYCLNCFRELIDADGYPIHDKRIKYCHVCRPIVEEKKKLTREQRFRDRHKEQIRLDAEKWRTEHPEERRLASRNWSYRHPEQHKNGLNSWRKRHPEKVKLQNKRAKKRQRLRMNKRLNSIGKYPKMKWEITCPKCNHVLKTSAKRPQCSCGYSFPRDYMEKFIDGLPTNPCKCCGREISYQFKQQIFKKLYCECCYPQIQALKKVLCQIRNPDCHNWHEWYQNNAEIVVAVTCIFCDEIIPGRTGKRVCRDCMMKWCRVTPQKIRDILASWPSFTLLPKDLLAWRRIMHYRNKGIYSLKD